MKGPRRRAWWICGAIVAPLALFALLSLESQRRAERKAERTDLAVYEFIQEFAFRDITTGLSIESFVYFTAPLGSDQRGDRALKQIRYACRGMDYEVKEARALSGDIVDEHVFTARTRSGEVWRLEFLIDRRSPNRGARFWTEPANETVPAMFLELYRRLDPEC